ncbi:cysteine-rich CWC family protein [Viridibacillus sp. YIM B01967]|uniref:Cysteine-rich CWC family protein n=1 Tax=Viridibacillus soli TaxID=2798301 RepID=A0ABS1H4Y6_9BACL|nr:cysteine-rich CWC family protein [Viridibacillus soli]MBK3494118.1 cysteine-rich CWC family protein [Viridibacillus soli]
MTDKNFPLCGEGNRCMAGIEGQGNCWCYIEGEFPKGIFELVPPESKAKHCICKKCVDTYREETEMKK